jgi:hypothetical protein
VVILGLYPPLYEHLPTTQTEVFCFFLMTAWIEHSLRAPGSLTHTLIAAGLLAFLCLTKVMYGVVATGYLAVLLVLWLRRRQSPLTRAYLRSTALALLLCVPYLTYTYNLTGRLFYWSSAGPQSFYWLTTPNPDEWGDWYHHGWVQRVPSLRAQHGAIMDEISGLTKDPRLDHWQQLFNSGTPEASDVLLRQARRNIREHPLKFARNWGGNLVRLFLDVPTSFRGTPFWNNYSMSHLALLFWTGFVILFSWRRKIHPPTEWWPLGLFLLLALGAYSLSASVARFLIPVLPLWWAGTWCWVGQHPAVSAPGERQQGGQAA